MWSAHGVAPRLVTSFIDKSTNLFHRTKETVCHTLSCPCYVNRKYSVRTCPIILIAFLLSLSHKRKILGGMFVTEIRQMLAASLPEVYFLRPRACDWLSRVRPCRSHSRPCGTP